MRRDAVALRQLEPHREETVLGRIPIRAAPCAPAGRTAGAGSHWISAGVTSLLSIFSIVWDIAIEVLRSRPEGPRFLASEEVTDDHCDFRSMALEREMTSIEQVDFGVGVVAFESLRASRQKERIVLAPHRKKRRPLCAEVVLEFGIKRDVAFIVAKQVELYLVIAGPGEECRVERPSIRGEPFPIRCAVRVLPLRGLWR